MGLGFPFGSSGRTETLRSSSSKRLSGGILLQGDPNPTRFIIKYLEPHGDFLIAIVEYPDCLNYEGKKIIVFQGLIEEEINKLKWLDPHFTEDSKIVARLVPTVQGLKLARKMVI